MACLSWANSLFGLGKCRRWSAMPWAICLWRSLKSFLGDMLTSVAGGWMGAFFFFLCLLFSAGSYIPYYNVFVFCGLVVVGVWAYFVNNGWRMSFTFRCCFGCFFVKCNEAKRYYLYGKSWKKLLFRVCCLYLCQWCDKNTVILCVCIFVSCVAVWTTEWGYSSFLMAIMAGVSISKSVYYTLYDRFKGSASSHWSCFL